MGSAVLTTVIRTVTDADVAAVASIFGWYAINTLVTFEEIPRSVDDWHAIRATLGTRGLPFLVADSGAGIAGYAYASPWRNKPAYRHTVEDSVFIAPDQIGRGIGRQLLTALLSAAAEAGARQMIAVIADTGDAASTALHESCGFTRAGRLAAVGYKKEQWLDTVLMQRHLG